MNLPKAVAKLRLTYHLNMIDLVNVAYQLGVIDGDHADHQNKRHLKQCFDCYERLGYKLPTVVKQFKDEKP